MICGEGAVVMVWGFMGMILTPSPSEVGKGVVGSVVAVLGRSGGGGREVDVDVDVVSGVVLRGEAVESARRRVKGRRREECMMRIARVV